MRRLWLRPLAELDIDGAALHYADAGGVELGLRFLDAVARDVAVDVIAEPDT